MKVVFVLFSILLLGGCGWLYQTGNNSSSEFDISAADMEVPDFQYVNQNEEAFGTEQLSGHYWLANMIFTNCPSVCPTMTPNMRNLQNAMLDEGVDMKFVTFTIDPKRDTPELLKAYGTNVGANFKYWNFITGYTNEEIATFAMETFKTTVQYIEEEDDFVHPTSFFLVDPGGKIIRKYDGLQSNQEGIIKDLKQTVQ
ncbi:SCO family protein [Halalkalibacter urbisdiaboli]|uniref:SCO family protein n=1 Tax=Halalkalibacter urbisdiaboli TaxID=1960589 RepID=UPI000B452964|nr:SCO family protein [Halalkalibacter urbisdiaboli]